MDRTENSFFNLTENEKNDFSEGIMNHNSVGEGMLTNGLKFFMYSLGRKRKLTHFLNLLFRYSGNTQELLNARTLHQYVPEVHIDGSRPLLYNSAEFTPFLFIISPHTIFADNVYQDLLYLESGYAGGMSSAEGKTHPDYNFWISCPESKSSFLIECRNSSSASGIRRLYSLVTGSCGLGLSDIGTLNFSEDNIITVTWKQIYLTLNNPVFANGNDEELAFLIEKMKIPMYRAGLVKEPGEIELRNMDKAESISF